MYEVKLFATNSERTDLDSITINLNLPETANSFFESIQAIYALPMRPHVNPEKDGKLKISGGGRYKYTLTLTQR